MRRQVKRSDRRARLRTQAATGGAQACFALACDLRTRTPVRVRESMVWLQKAAEQGLAEAQWALGFCHDRGVDIGKRNARKAVFWWRKAAAQGSADALLDLGVAHAFGDGVRKDRSAANRFEGVARAGRPGRDPARSRRSPRVRRA